MVAGPDETPPIRPVASIDAIVVADELHVPPAVLSLSMEVIPAHMDVMPVIAEGSAFTVTTALLVQPRPSAYVIVAVPPAMPVTLPLRASILAMAVLLLLHDPPPDELLSAAAVPTQKAITPDIVPEVALTLTVFVALQPEEIV